jgi:dihydroorotase
MAQTFDMLIRGGVCVTPEGIMEADVGTRQGRVTALGDLGSADAAEVINAAGLHVLPGAIDSQVHFREPGGEAKEDLASGSEAAVMGGITAVFEMPNTWPPTTDAAALEDKLERAKGRMYCDHAFYVGGTPDNAQGLAELERHAGCAGVKVFMGSSTGTLLVAGDEALREILSHGRRRVAIHAEDEQRLEERKPFAESGKVETHPVWRDEEVAFLATKRIVNLGRETGRRIHVLHVTTSEELQLLAGAKDIATIEVTPQHLTLTAPECYRLHNTFAQMNPPIREARHHEAIWQAVAGGIVDVVGSDHAPHTVEEKHRPYPESPAGMPGVQTLMPLLLNHLAEGRLSLDRLVDLTAHGQARIFGLSDKGRLEVGRHADFTIVDLDHIWTIGPKWLRSRAGWSPFEGKTIKGKVKGTIIRGARVMWDDEILGLPAGLPLCFDETAD